MTFLPLYYAFLTIWDFHTCLVQIQCNWGMIMSFQHAKPYDKEPVLYLLCTCDTYSSQSRHPGISEQSSDQQQAENENHDVWSRTTTKAWATFQYPRLRLMVRSRKVSKLRKMRLELYDCSEIDRHLGSSIADVPVNGISKRCNDLNYQSHEFDTSRDLTIISIFGYWNRVMAMTDRMPNL